ncbi:hypothetical protein [Clostridium sp. BJN0001]|uniref:hypothetical protein n=1 Tax=Clostridium sp. BJN0001 TaxID=2930219 RepID=UPI001FD0F44F|nr:hypothetical protein [Clostridium sp. BJN0001]
MKKFIHTLILTILCINIFSLNTFKVYGIVESREKDYLNNNRQIIRDLKHNIESEDISSSDVRKDFFGYFFHINKSSIRMNENILKYTKNKYLAKQAKISIKKCLNNEMQMAALLECINEDLSEDKEKAESFNSKFKETYNEMLYKLKNQEFKGRVDLDFKDTINIHHEYSIAICTESLKYINGKTEYKVINNIIKDYQNDLKKYEDIIN